MRPAPGRTRLHGADVGSLLEVEALAGSRGFALPRPVETGLLYLGIEDQQGRAVGDTFDAENLLRAVARACEVLGLDVEAVLAGDDDDDAARDRLR